MANKIIAAGSAAALAIVGMVSFVNAESISANTVSAEVEGTMVSTGSAVETITTTAAGEADESERKVKPSDLISINYCVDLQRPDGRVETTFSDEKIYVIGMDDENQRFRVYVARFCTKKKGVVLYLSYADTVDAVVITHSGYFMGDMFDDPSYSIDIFDVAIMKKKLLNDDWSNNVLYTLADMNADSEVSVVDLVILQRRVLGIPDEFA